MNREIKYFKQTVFLSEHCAVSEVATSVRSAVFRHRPTIALSVVYCFADNTLFEVSSEISLFWCVKSLPL